MPKQAEITIKFTTDLDPLPGACHTPEYWLDYITHNFLRQSHYNTKVQVERVAIIEAVSVLTSKEVNDYFRSTEA